MIERYCRPAMSRVWSEARRLELWLEVELAMTGAREAEGSVPAGTTRRIRERARLDPARMLAIEAEVRHDVIAFLRMLAESIGDDARHVHAGMTSSDLVDTADRKRLIAEVLRSGDAMAVTAIVAEPAKTARFNLNDADMKVLPEGKWLTDTRVRGLRVSAKIARIGLC